MQAEVRGPYRTTQAPLPGPGHTPKMFPESLPGGSPGAWAPICRIPMNIPGVNKSSLAI